MGHYVASEIYLLKLTVWYKLREMLPLEVLHAITEVIFAVKI